MLRKFTLILMLLLCLSTFAMFSSHKANAAVIAKNPTTTLCQAVSHGSQPATYQCTKSNTPDALSCVGFDLSLWWAANGQGSILCMHVGNGSPLFNLTNYFDSRGISWNDQASSYQTFCSNVTFYTDINQGGSSVTVGPFSGIRNFTPGAVPNDKLSSVFINVGC